MARADARRNRARILEVADEAFASEGLSVSVHEIARRAGMGTGTVSRHFPTKQDLYAAVLVQRVRSMMDRLDASPGGSADPFFRFFATLAREGATHRGLAEALASDGIDVDAALKAEGYDIEGRLFQMLKAAQKRGTVRDDVDVHDVKALLKGCMARDIKDRQGFDRLIEVICTGLKPAG